MIKKRNIAVVVVLTIFLLVITIDVAQAQIKPNYELFIKLSNHNIKPNEPTYLYIDIIGYGKCDKGQISVYSEIPLIFSDVNKNVLVNAHSLFESHLKETEYNVSYCINQSGKFSAPSYAQNMDFQLDKSVFSTEETKIKINLKIEPNKEFQKKGGEYSLRAFLFCNQNNESFIFKDDTKFRVMFENESQQYTMAFFAIIISILAVLLTLVKDFFIPAIFKPKLKIEAKNDSECIETDSKHSRYLRIKLINDKGFFSRKAEQCYVKLLGIKDKNNQCIYPFTPFPLKWSLYDDPNGNINVGSRTHDLQAGDYYFIDVVHEYNGKRYFLIQGPLSQQLLDNAEEKLGPGEYRLEVGIYGSNFKPIFHEIKIELGEKFGELKFI